MLTDNKVMTMREIYNAESFAQVRVFLISECSMFVEGKIRKVEEGETYWIGNCHFSADAKLRWDDICELWTIQGKTI